MKFSLARGDSFDLKATSKNYDAKNKQVVFGTDLYVEVPKGCVAVIKAKPSLENTLLEFNETVLHMGWHQIEVRFGRGLRPYRNYEVGDVVAQLEVQEI
jgi:hypothetical protein